MAITEPELMQAETRMALVREAGYAVSARYDRRRSRIVVVLNIARAAIRTLEDAISGAYG